MLSYGIYKVKRDFKRRVKKKRIKEKNIYRREKINANFSIYAKKWYIIRYCIL